MNILFLQCEMSLLEILKRKTFLQIKSLMNEWLLKRFCFKINTYRPQSFQLTN